MCVATAQWLWDGVAVLPEQAYAARTTKPLRRKKVSWNISRFVWNVNMVWNFNFDEKGRAQDAKVRTAC